MKREACFASILHRQFNPSRGQVGYLQLLSLQMSSSDTVKEKDCGSCFLDSTRCGHCLDTLGPAISSSYQLLISDQL